MGILEQGYRPWPKLHAGDAKGDAFYRRLDRNKPAHIDELRAYTTRVDRVRNEQELKTQLTLFGKAVLISLEASVRANTPFPGWQLLRTRRRFSDWDQWVQDNESKKLPWFYRSVIY